jgi:hypothetical protein
MGDWAGKGGGESDQGCCGGMSIPMVPAPLIFVAGILAFLIGLMIGGAVSRKRTMMMSGMHGGKHGMHKHHHHGHGAPACRDPQCDWPSRMMAAEETAEPE